jgi:DNA topoisomerase-1
VKRVLFVESPVKARKIWGILKGLYPDDDYSVEATFGHIVDLPEKEFAVRPEQDFSVSLVIRNRKAYLKLMTAASQADEIYLATDPDREGEAIARYLSWLIDQRGIQVPMHRLRFNEVTKAGIKTAFEQLTDIDHALCEAQLARRVLDRVVGFAISPVLWKKLNFGMSAGRVQSFALAEVVRRERERRSHVPRKQFQIECLISGVLCRSSWHDKQTIKKYITRLDGSGISRHKLESIEYDDLIKPRVPYTTSTLLQDASRILASSSTDTMAMLQSMFESGYITYHRTDSIRLAPGFIKAAREFIVDTAKDSRYVPKKPRFFPGSGAHEAIRPVSPENTPASMKTLTGKARELYKLIWVRAVCSQASSAEVKRQAVRAYYLAKQTKTKKMIVEATGMRLTFDGWTRFAFGLFVPQFNEIELPEKPELDLDSIKKNASWTTPPERWTESSLIKHMDETGVGRPSTYASIMSTLTRQRYVSYAGGGRLGATRRGELLIYFLEHDENIRSLLDENFTAGMEADLDSIANGTDSVMSALVVLGKCWNWLEPALRSLQTVKFPEIHDTSPKTGEDLNLSVIVPRAGEPFLQAVQKKTKSGKPSYFGLDFDKVTNEPKIFRPRVLKDQICSNCKSEGTLETQQSKYGVFVRCTSCHEVDKKARF